MAKRKMTTTKPYTTDTDIVDISGRFRDVTNNSGFKNKEFYLYKNEKTGTFLITYEMRLSDYFTLLSCRQKGSPVQYFNMVQQVRSIVEMSASKQYEHSPVQSEQTDIQDEYDEAAEDADAHIKAVIAQAINHFGSREKFMQYIVNHS